MSITNFYAKKGAPLKNQRWSWGALRKSDDGAVFLRVWQDRRFVEDKTMYMMVTHHEKYVGTDEENLGYQERLEHVEQVRNGSDLYMIMCRVNDPDASPRKIASYNSQEVFVGEGWLTKMGIRTLKSSASELSPMSRSVSIEAQGQLA